MAVLAVDESLIDTIVSRADVLQAFPWMQRFANGLRAAGRPGCGRCRQRHSQKTSLYNTFKQSLIGMTEQDRIKLKKILGAESLKVTLQIGGRIQAMQL